MFFENDDDFLRHRHSAFPLTGRGCGTQGPASTPLPQNSVLMPSPNHYVPILKAKQGDIDGLATVPVELRGMITAVLELTRPGYKRVKTENPAKPIESVRVPFADHINGVTRHILKQLSEGPRLLLDVADLEEERARMPDGTHPLRFMLETLSEEGFRVRPVLSTGLSQETQAEVADLVRALDCGCCLRLQDRDFRWGMQAPAYATEFIELQGIPDPSWCDLILDFGGIQPDKVGVTMITAGAMAKAFGRSGGWRSITVAGTGLVTTAWPRDVDAGEVVRIVRTEREVLRVAAEECPRPVSYGDYGISGHLPMEPTEFLAAGVKLRYTAPTEYLMFYEGKLEDVGGAGFQAIARQVVRMPEFTPGLSWGDDFLSRAAAGGPPGGTKAWVQVGTSHHVMFVLRELGLLD